MDIAVFVLATAAVVLSAAFLIGLFVWAARKDVEEDRALQPVHATFAAGIYSGSQPSR